MSPVNLASAAPAAPTDRAKLAVASAQFEAIFIRQMLAAARQASHGDPIFGNGGEATFREMLDNRWADIASQSGALGLGRMIETQLARQMNLPVAGKD